MDGSVSPRPGLPPPTAWARYDRLQVKAVEEEYSRGQMQQLEAQLQEALLQQQQQQEEAAQHLQLATAAAAAAATAAAAPTRPRQEAATASDRHQ